MNSKFFGGVLLVVGTNIGAGMLALPIATSQLGFWGAVVQLVGCWALMMACSYIFLEVNLRLPDNSNLISMAGATLGRIGQVVAWVVYLILLYSIISAYISGGGDLFHYVLGTTGFHVSTTVGSILFTILFGAVVFFGIRSVDYVNRGLMFGKLGALIILTCLVVPFVTTTNLDRVDFKYITSPTSIMVTAVAFGAFMIIPTLRTYFNDDIKTLRKVLFIGTLIPLLCYIAWDMVVMGVVPLHGAPGLMQIVHSPNSNSELVIALTTLLQKDSVAILAKFFTSICMATSFLSVSLSLMDFLADGLNIAKKGLGNVFIFLCTFLPPLVLVLFYPDAFMRGLEFAGLSIVILMVLMPPLMAWRGRYYDSFSSNANGALAQEAVYQVAGGKSLLILVLFFALVMMAFGIYGLI